MTPIDRRGLALAAWAVIAAGALPARADDSIGKEIGEVTWMGLVVRANPEGEKERPLKVKDAVRIGETIRTGKGSNVLLRFDKDGTLGLHESTRVRLGPPPRPGVVATVTVEKGALFLEHDAGSPFSPQTVEVETPEAKIRLKGTKVTIVVVKGKTEVTVLEGEAEVTSKAATGRGEVVRKNLRTQVAQGRDPMTPFPANPRLPVLTAGAGISPSILVELLDVALLTIDP